MSTATEELTAGRVIDGFRLREPRDTGGDVAEWLAVRVEGGQLVSLRIPCGDRGRELLAAEWRTRRQIREADAVAGNGHFRRLDESALTAGEFPGYLAGEVVPARSLQQELMEGHAPGSETAVLVLEALLELLERCQQLNVPPPDLAAPCVHVVDRQVIVSGIGTGTWEAVGPVLRDLALAMHGPEPDAAVQVFANVLPDQGMPVVPGHLRGLLDSVLGARRSDRLASVGSGDFAVTCPKCGVRYLLSAGVCKPCKIDLRTGAPLLEIRAATRRRQRESGESSSRIGSTGWLVAACLFGVIAVTGAAFGWTWVAVSIGLGVGLAVLVLTTVLLGT